MAVPRHYSVWKNMKAKVYKTELGWTLDLCFPETLEIFRRYIFCDFQALQESLKILQFIIRVRKFPLKYIPGSTKI